jgi:hypothetical protein
VSRVKYRQFDCTRCGGAVKFIEGQRSSIAHCGSCGAAQPIPARTGSGSASMNVASGFLVFAAIVAWTLVTRNAISFVLHLTEPSKKLAFDLKPPPVAQAVFWVDLVPSLLAACVVTWAALAYRHWLRSRP